MMFFNLKFKKSHCFLTQYLADHGKGEECNGPKSYLTNSIAGDLNAERSEALNTSEASLHASKASTQHFSHHK